MNMPTPQQEGFYRQLAKFCDLTVVYGDDIAQGRRALGWNISPEGYKHCFVNSMQLVRRFVPESADFHLLAGLPGGIHNLGRVIFASGRTQIGVQAEMRIPEVETTRRRIQTILYSSILNLREVAFFGIGQEIREYYLTLRVPPERIFPFAYFSPEARTVGATRTGPILFVGQIVHRKGVDILLEAFARSSVRGSHELVLIGHGKEQERLEAIAHQRGVRERVHFAGVVDYHRITAFMNGASVLVLPSRHDGWGFVVNEALSVGLPVIVSDRCGASEVIKVNGGGFVFESGNTEKLTFALDQLLLSEHVWRSYSEAALAAHACVSAEAGARYFIETVKYILSGYVGERPVAPWLSGRQARRTRDEA